MAYRMIEFVLPSTSEASIRDQLDDFAILGHWTIEQRDDTQLVRVLVRLEETEGVINALEERFTFSDDFRVMLSEVTATLPRPDSDEEEAKRDEESKEKSGDAEDDSPPPERVAAIELIETLSSASQLSWNYVLTLVLSVIVAALGLARDSVAVVIGAMVIAPLLSPNMAIALGTTLGDLPLLKQAAKATVVGLALSAALSIAAGFVFPVDPTVPEIAARCVVAPADIALALAAGAAGALAFTSGVAAGVVGVMVAVALLPPLVVSGLMVGIAEWEMAYQAFLLHVCNVIGVNLAGIITFAAKGVRPGQMWEEKKARVLTRSAIVVWTIAMAALLVVFVWVLPGEVSP